MLIHVIRHVPFEGPARIAEWAKERGHALSESLAVTGEFPAPDSIDFVVVMGGPMAADDESASPWLAREKRFVADAIAHDRLALGVCLGAQILAEAAGGAIRRNEYREIGWYPVSRTPAADSDPVFGAFPDGLVVGHWHGDTFDLPDGIKPMLSSEACPNQAFSLRGGRVVGVQFHLEWTVSALATLASECADELADGGAYVMNAGQILDEAPEHLMASEPVLWALLDAMVALPNTQEIV